TTKAYALAIVGAEYVLRWLPRGTHDPALFIKPAALRAMLVERGFDVAPFKGLAPTGIDRRLDFTFGIVPMTDIIYVGTATKRLADEG
ncbi:MAG: bifunctional 3-demethylubiquinol 3-O-methyltransferase/2-polyprenyl-6-hydroxyphenol methylase, partial [Pseudomonadota bacterium]